MTALPTSGARLTAFAIVVAAIIAATGAYLYLTRPESSSTSSGESRLDEEAATREIEKIRRDPYVAFRDLRPGQTYGHLAFAALATTADRVASEMQCNRVYFSDATGLCLAIATAPAGFHGYLLGDALKITQTLSLPGMPSRARVSRDSRFGAFTAFVAGDSYLASGLSTRTRIVRAPSGEDVADLESFAVLRNGEEIYSIDFNFWGVTFTKDSNRIYATLGTGGKILLVEGDVAERTFRVIAEDIECPSLSPDETHIAFKKRFGSGLDAWWQPAVIELATMTVRELPEPKHIDDQIEWLDDGHILYAVGHSPSSTARRGDVWRLAIDGSSAPSLFLADAESPAIVRP